jgi:hypothetical protein
VRDRLIRLGIPLALFYFVIIAHRRGWLSAITTRMGWVGLGMAIGAILVFLPSKKFRRFTLVRLT